MRILHVVETLSPRYGGPALLLPQLATHMEKAGHEVVVATTNADYPAGRMREPGWDTLEGTRVSAYFGAVSSQPMKISLDLARYLRREVRSFDLAHVHGLYRFPQTYASYEARRQRVPYVIQTHGMLDPYLFARSSRSVTLKRAYERLFDFPNLHGASAVHFTTEEERRRASFLALRSPSFVLPVGVSWERYAELPDHGQLRATLGVGEAPMILFLGRIHFKKGLDLLVPAFAEVRKSFPDAQLVIAGPENDGYGQSVRRWIQNHDLEGCVHLIGALQGKDVDSAYVDADVFVLPSYTESFGVAVVEAMACGLPVVVSDQVNIFREVRDAGAGMVTRCRVDEVASSIAALLADDGMRAQMGRSGRALVESSYSWPRIVDGLTAEYHRILVEAA